MVKASSKVLQAGFNRGHLAAHQLIALGADQAKLVIQADRVEPADAAVVEQLSDAGEIMIGAVGQALVVPRTMGKGWWPSACSYLRTWASSSRSSAVRRAGSARGGRPTIVPCFFPLAALRVRSLSCRSDSALIARSHLGELALGELDVGVADVSFELADVGQLGLEGDLGFDDLKPERFDPHLPLVVDQALAGELGLLGVLGVDHRLFKFESHGLSKP